MLGKSLLIWGMKAANIMAVFIMILAMIGTVLSPEKFVYVAYLTLAFPFIVAINIAFVLFWILSRNWFFLASLSLLIFSASEIGDTFPIHLGKTEIIQVHHPIQILTYNTMGSGEQKKHKKNKPNKVIQYILDSNADIVCLQEFTVSSNDEYLTYEDIMRIFTKYPYKHIQFNYNQNKRQSGVATFSKYPIINKHKINYQSGFNGSIYSDININGKIVRFVNNHLESNKITESDKEMPIQLKNDFNTANLSGVTLKFSRKLGSAYKLRAHQADEVSKVINSSPYKVIVCGDFNDVPSSYAYTKIKGKLKDTFSEIGNGFGWSFNEKFYHFRIDYILYDSTEFSPVEYKMDKVNYSDHYPVFCELNINSEPKIN
ncbi:MAG: endonuclease/exonuclease/phosphatase family protein [Paludibacter sp.]